MVDLTQSQEPSPLIHRVPTDPGNAWVKDEDFAIDAPPDDDPNPAPEAAWSTDAVRTGVCGSVAARVIKLPDGDYRMYYTQMIPRSGFAAGANDYDNVSARILSAISTDGQTWTPEPGVRLSPQDGGAGEFRVVLTDVVPDSGQKGRLRMYFEYAPGPQSKANAIRSAVSENGLSWTVEPGDRFADGQGNYNSARIICLDGGHFRLYGGQRGIGIVSALSEDGLTFTREPGVRIPRGGTYDTQIAFAPEVMSLPSGTVVMYYAGYQSSKKAYILRATSRDGLNWEKETEPAIAPDGRWDAAKSSEMCLFTLPRNGEISPRYRIVYEACDGTSLDQRGVWRIATATSSP